MRHCFSTFQKLEIRTRLVVYYIAFAFTTIGAVIYFAYTEASRSLQATVNDRLSTVAELKRDSLVQWLNEQQRYVALLANLPEMRSFSEELLDPAASPQDRTNAQRELTDLLRG